jgi:hypothetical protein
VVLNDGSVRGALNNRGTLTVAPVMDPLGEPIVTVGGIRLGIDRGGAEYTDPMDI